MQAAIIAGAVQRRGRRASGRMARCAGVVAAGTPSAADAGAFALQQGGNAADAAAAAFFALAVTDPANASLAGRAQILVAHADSRLDGIDGATQAPRKLDRRRPADDRPSPYRAVPIPGAVAAVALLVKRHGRLPLARAVEPALRLAEDGFAVTPRLAANWAAFAPALQRDEEAASIFLKRDGSAYERGEYFRQPRLAATLGRIATDGPEGLYQGYVARALARHVTSRGGTVSESDLEEYRAIGAPIVRSEYRGYPVASLGGSAWGDTVIEMLNILDHFPLASEASGRRAEIMARVLSCALDDRPQELGTLRPKPNGYPLDTLSARSFAAGRAERIRRELQHDPLPAGRHHRRPGETSHLSVMDAEGNAVALTTSIGPAFGARAACAELGLLFAHSYRMRVDPVPGERDHTEMSPTVIMSGERPALALGAAGNENIPVAVVQVISNLVDSGLPLHTAVSEPRMLSVGSTVQIESDFDDADAERLRVQGFAVERTTRPLGKVHAVQLMQERDELVGAADPRHDGMAVAV